MNASGAACAPSCLAFVPSNLWPSAEPKLARIVITLATNHAATPAAKLDVTPTDVDETEPEQSHDD